MPRYTFAPPKPKEEMSLEDYLGLYNMFSPEHNVALAEGINKLRQTGQGEEFAQQHGAPNLTAMKLGEEEQQHESTLGLRRAMIDNRSASADTNAEERAAQLALSMGQMPEAKRALAAVMGKLGLQSAASGGMTDEQRKQKLQALLGVQ